MASCAAWPLRTALLAALSWTVPLGAEIRRHLNDSIIKWAVCIGGMGWAEHRERVLVLRPAAQPAGTRRTPSLPEAAPQPPPLQIVDPIWGCYNNGKLQNSSLVYRWGGSTHTTPDSMPTGGRVALLLQRWLCRPL